LTLPASTDGIWRIGVIAAASGAKSPQMAAAGAPSRAIQEWMGHADAKTTEIYRHYAPDPTHGAAFVERTERVRSLPTLSQAAQFIGMDTGGMSRIVRSLGIEPQRWGRRDKHLAAAQVLQIARVAQRASLEEVAGNILEWTEQKHPDAVQRTTAEIDAFFAELPDPTATPANDSSPSCAPPYRRDGRTRPRRSGALTRAPGPMSALDRRAETARPIESYARTTRRARGALS
jgi:hypothetical protein